VRIAHVSDCYEPRIGGIEYQVRELARRQRQQGHDVTVITCVPGPGTAAADSTGPRVVRPCPRRPSDREPAPLIRYWSTPKQLAAFTGRSFDAVHVHLSTFSPLAFSAARSSSSRGVPTVITIHSLLSGWTSAYRGLAALVQARSWRVAWSAVSAAAADSLRAVLGDEIVVHVVPNAVEACAWATEAQSPHDGHLRIVSVGRLAARKRPLPLVRILHRARQMTPTHIRLSAVLVGDGPQRGRIERAAHRRGMDWLQTPGMFDAARIRELHAGSHLYVAPARRESFGIAALEAHCAGLPVLGFRRTGLADFIDHEVQGQLVTDDESMARAIARLARQPELLHRLAGNARCAPRHVGWDAVTSVWEALYGLPLAVSAPAAAPLAHT
jgi:glycosyltransferase involved in cell wall biosynthesis